MPDLDDTAHLEIHGGVEDADIVRGVANCVIVV